MHKQSHSNPQLIHRKNRVLHSLKANTQIFGIAPNKKGLSFDQLSKSLECQW
jgi:hypothetical protein